MVELHTGIKQTLFKTKIKGTTLLNIAKHLYVDNQENFNKDNSEDCLDEKKNDDIRSITSPIKTLRLAINSNLSWCYACFQQYFIFVFQG